jgi:hypothetical protein
MRRASQLGSAQKGGRRVGRGDQEQHADGGDSTFLTSLPGGGERQHHLPTIDGLQVYASDDLEERLDALSQAIGLEGTKLLKGALQAEFTHICRLSRWVTVRSCASMACMLEAPADSQQRRPHLARNGLHALARQHGFDEICLLLLPNTWPAAPCTHTTPGRRFLLRESLFLLCASLLFLPDPSSHPASTHLLICRLPAHLHRGCTGCQVADTFLLLSFPALSLRTPVSIPVSLHNSNPLPSNAPPHPHGASPPFPASQHVIPATCCACKVSGAVDFEDILCSVCCQPCALAQMATHTGAISNESPCDCCDAEDPGKEKRVKVILKIREKGY